MHNVRAWLIGKKTYLLVGLAVATELVKWGTGDQTLSALLEHLPAILGELAIGTLRAGVALNAQAQQPHIDELKGLLADLAHQPAPGLSHLDVEAIRADIIKTMVLTHRDVMSPENVRRSAEDLAARVVAQMGWQ